MSSIVFLYLTTLENLAQSHTHAHYVQDDYKHNKMLGASHT